jgi:hypothetical protein
VRFQNIRPECVGTAWLGQKSAFAESGKYPITGVGLSPCVRGRKML